MKKMAALLAMALVLTVLVPCCASAVTLTIENGLPDEYPFTYMLRHGDTLHCLTVGSHGKYSNGLNEITLSTAAQCDVLQDGALVPCENHCADRFQAEDRVIDNPIPMVLISRAIIDLVISPENETFLIDRDWSVYRWTPSEEEPWRFQCQLDISLLDFDEYVSWVTFTTDGESLFGTFSEVNNDSGTEQRGTAFVFSLADGSCEKLFGERGLRTVYPVDDQTVLYQGVDENGGRFQCHYLYDLTTGQKTVFQTAGVDFLTPDGKGGWYGIASSGYATYGLYPYDAQGNIGEILTDLSFEMLSASISVSEDGKTVYICGNGDGKLCVFTLNGEAGELVLAGSVNEFNWNGSTLPDFTDFTERNGGARLIMADYPVTFDDLAMELISGSDRFDLMALELSMGNVGSLLDKGYYVDLSGDETVASYVRSMYPTWRDACLRDERIVGLPIGVRNIWTFMVDLEVWEEEGLGDKPKTYDELFDCIEEWDALGVLDEVPLFDNFRGDSFERLLDRVMIDYMGKREREGKSVAFEDATLLRLLGRLEALRPILDAHDARNVSGSGLIFEGIVSNVLGIKGLNKFTLEAGKLPFEPLTLGIDSAEDCVESVFFTMLVINPNSQRQELARAYLDYLAENPTLWACCYLMEGGLAGVRREGCEDVDERYAQREPELREQIAAAMKENDDDAINALEKELRELTEEYRGAWELRPDLAEMVDGLMPSFTPLTGTGYRFYLTNGDDLTEMFVEGVIDSRTYVQRLDQRMWMAEMEGSR